MTRLLSLQLSAESLKEVRATTLSTDLGFTDLQVVMDSIIGSEEAWVFLDRKTRGILGVAGVAQSIANGEIVVVPWFLTSGFERLPENRRLFLKAAKELMRSWETMARGKLFVNTCLNERRITKFLKYLGFTVEPSIETFTLFWKKGGTP